MSKKKILDVILVIEAAICIALSLLWRGQYSENLFDAIKIPFKTIGQGLRDLSLSGTSGNTIAIILYCILCLIPVIIALIMLITKKARMEDTLSILVSAITFWGMYIFINPSMIPTLSVLSPIYESAIIMTVFSTIILWIIIRLVRSLNKMKKTSLIRIVKIICAIVLMFMVVAICFIGVSELLAKLQEARDNNIYVQNTYALLIFKYMMEQIPNVCMIVIVTKLLNVAGVIRQGYIGEGITIAVKNMSNICKKVLVIILAASVVLNIVQIAMAKVVSITDYSINIPVFYVLFIIVLLIISRMVEESQKIKEDNDMFI